MSDMEIRNPKHGEDKEKAKHIIEGFSFIAIKVIQDQEYQEYDKINLQQSLTSHSSTSSWNHANISDLKLM